MIKNGSNKTRVCPHCGEILFRGDDWGNDEPGQTVDNVEINLYTPILHNAEELTRKVRRMIARNTDFTFPRIQYSCYPEKRCKCATFTCEYME